MAETMTPEEESFIRKNKTYGKYKLFFDSLYFEFKQQTRKRPDDPLSRCKRECLNSVLRPLREMMKDEEYADLLRLIPDNADEELSCSDVMMILTQYRSALEKFHSSHK